MYFLVLFVHLADPAFQSSWKIREHDQLFKMKCSKLWHLNVQCQTKYQFDTRFSCAVGSIWSHYEVLIFSWPCSSHYGKIHVLIYCCTIQNVKPMGMWLLELTGGGTGFFGVEIQERLVVSFGKESVELLWISNRIAGIWIELKMAFYGPFPPLFFSLQENNWFLRNSLWTCEDSSFSFSTF